MSSSRPDNPDERGDPMSRGFSTALALAVTMSTAAVLSAAEPGNTLPDEQPYRRRLLRDLVRQPRILQRWVCVVPFPTLALGRLSRGSQEDVLRLRRHGAPASGSCRPWRRTTITSAAWCRGPRSSMIGDSGISNRVRWPMATGTPRSRVDGDGRVWVFVSGHGDTGYIYRATEPVQRRELRADHRHADDVSQPVVDSEQGLLPLLHQVRSQSRILLDHQPRRQGPGRQRDAGRRPAN